MLTREQNELLTRVESSAPMGTMMRQHYWFPFLRAERVQAGGDPIRVRLLGENYVVFRATDGRVGFFDEACPHRGASLVLARNEGCALRCIFHGWKIDVSGKVLEAPSEANRPEEFVKKVPVRHYPVRETGTLLWVWLGAGEAPKFPDFEFTSLPDNHVYATYTPVACNWLQGVEGTLDSAHVGLLHQSWISKLTPSKTRSIMTSSLAPRYEFERRPYGLRAVAIRPLDDGSEYARIGEFVLPFYMFVGSSNSEAGERVLFISVPVDDKNSILFYLRYRLAEAGPLNRDVGFQTDLTLDPDNFAPLRGDASTNWGQDRAAMKTGHFTGFTDNIIAEDIVVQVSMGPIVDRTKEYLCSSDVAVVQARRLLLTAVADAQAGKVPLGAQASVDHRSIRADARVLPPGKRWQDLYTPKSDVAASEASSA